MPAASSIRVLVVDDQLTMRALVRSALQQIGFTEPCAETWAYNAQKTAQSCPLVCIRTYGLLPLLKGEEVGVDAAAANHVAAGWR